MKVDKEKHFFLATSSISKLYRSSYTHERMSDSTNSSISRYPTVNSLISLFEDVAKTGAINKDATQNPYFSIQNRAMVMDRLINLLEEHDKKIKEFQEHIVQVNGLLPRLADLEAKVGTLASNKCSDYNKQIKDLQEELALKNSGTAAVPVFSVKKCLNPEGKAKNRVLGFSTSGFKTNTDYGKFSNQKRFFTVIKPGIYQFEFTGFVLRTNGSRKYHFQLQVDGVVKSVCRANSNMMEFQQVSLSSLQQLEVGQKVSMIRVSGGLYEALNLNPTTFSCEFIADN